MMKKFLAGVLATLMIIVCCPVFVAKGASAPSISVSQLETKIEKLKSFSDKYFTRYGEKCVSTNPSAETASNGAHLSCNYCNNGTVLLYCDWVNNWITDEYGVSSSALNRANFPYQYKPSNSNPESAHFSNGNGWSCYGFSTFAQWYLFSTKSTDKVSPNLVVSGIKYTYENLVKYARPGDAIRTSSTSDGSNGQHSLIILSHTDSGITYIDCNGKNGNGCKINYTIDTNCSNYSGKYMSITRASNSPYINEIPVTLDDHSSETSLNGHTYRVYDCKTTWEAAKEQCEEWGGHLATITNSAEQNAVLGLVQDIDKPCWIGAYRASSSASTYQWVTGESMSYTNWDDGEPSMSSGSNAELYVGMYANDTDTQYSTTGKWNDFSATTGTIKGFVCEWDSSDSFPDGYLYKSLDDDTSNASFPGKWIRATDSSDGELIGSIPYGEYAVVTKYNSDKSWAYVKYGDAEGWTKVYEKTFPCQGLYNCPTVTFNANGGNVSTSSKKVYINTPYGTLPTPTRTGYTFNGWYTAASGGTKITDTTNVTLTANQTLYAHWTPNTCTVHLSTQGGGISTTDMTVTCGSTYGTIPTPSKPGYTFDGWYTALSGGTKVTSSTIVTNASNHTLYARWTAKTYTITYDANGGTTPTSSKTVTYASTYGTLPTPARTGYTFDGWYTYASGGTKITSNTNVSITANQTLYAQWTPVTYTVTFNNNGGTGGPTPQTKIHDTNLILSSAVPTRTNYNFNGWSTSASGSVEYAAGATYKNNSDITLYAVWTPIDIYTITYDANGGENAPAPQTKYHGITLRLSTQIPTREGYTFKGWAVSQYGNKTYDSNDTYIMDRSITLYAVWQKNIVNVSGVTLNKASVTLNVGDTETLTATVTPTNATDKTVTWTSSNPSVASVSNGVITAKAAGTTTITATTVDGGKTATCVVTVNAIDEDMPSLKINDITVTPGEEFYVDIVAENCDSVKAITVNDIEYSESLTLTNAEWLLTGSMLNAVDINGDSLIVFQNAVDVNKAVMRLYFTVDSEATDGDAYIRYKAMGTDASNKNFDFVEHEGAVTIRSFIIGDCDGDESITVDDAIYLAFYTFYSDRYPIPEGMNVDFDKDGVVTVDDAIHLAFHTFYPDRYPLN